MPPRSLPRHDEWPNLHNLDTTDDKLARAAVEIKRTADGKTCGDCTHFRQTYCDKHASSLTGHNLAVLFPTAIACTAFSAAEVRT
jgi:hypothetical protein